MTKENNRITLYVIVAVILLGHFSFLSCENEIKPVNFNSLNADISINTPHIPGYDILERMDAHDVPGVSIAVARNGKIAWAKGYGVANTETGEKVHTKTLFQAASISKPISALAVLHMLEQGELSLEKDVNIYLRDWKIGDNEYTQNEKVTLARLLTHTAGVSVHGFPGYSRGEKLPTVLEILDGKGNTNEVKVLAVPGSKWKYSGGGYTIVQKVIEDVSGHSLKSYMDKNVLRPIGMYVSTFEQPLSERYAQRASAGHNNWANPIPGLWHEYPELAAAGLWTTPTDLAKFCMEIHEILTDKKSGVLKKETIQLMLTKHNKNWGLGPRLDKDGDSLVFGHSGGNEGFSSQFLSFVYQGNALVIMANGDRCMDLVIEIQKSIIDAYKW